MRIFTKEVTNCYECPNHSTAVKSGRMKIICDVLKQEVGVSYIPGECPLQKSGDKTTIRENGKRKQNRIHTLTCRMNRNPSKNRSIDWYIFGLQTPIRKDDPFRWGWIEDFVKELQARNIPLFMKQSMKGKIPNEYYLQQFPKGLKKEA
jgi:hypothetical protein